MSDQKFLKANCQHCGGHIEFPAEGLGMSVSCPHCQAKTVLRVAEPAPQPVEARPPAPSHPPTPAAAPSPAPLPTTPAPAAAKPPIPPPPSAASRPVPPPPSAAGSTIPKAPASQPAPLPAAPKTTEARAAEKKGKSKVGLLLMSLVGLLLLGAFGYVGYNQFMGEKTERNAAPPPPSSPKASAGNQGTEPPSAPKAPSPSGPKTASDLKSSSVVLEKSRGGSSLVYAVGTIRNESDHQRFGVKVEVDILDAGGKKVGKATDYIQVIEPRNEWRFHALVLEDKASAAKIASIKEDE